MPEQDLADSSKKTQQQVESRVLAPLQPSDFRAGFTNPPTATDDGQPVCGAVDSNQAAYIRR